jgi:hypothetical protein
VCRNGQQTNGGDKSCPTSSIPRPRQQMFEVPPCPSGLLCDIYTVMVVSITRPRRHTSLSLTPLCCSVSAGAGAADSDMQIFSQPWSIMRAGQVVPQQSGKTPERTNPIFLQVVPPGPDDDHFPPDPWTHDDKAGPCSRCLAGERVSGRQRSPRPASGRNPPWLGSQGLGCDVSAILACSDGKSAMAFSESGQEDSSSGWRCRRWKRVGAAE